MTRGEASMKQTPVVTCWLCEREMGKQECLYDHVVITEMSSDGFVSWSLRFMRVNRTANVVAKSARYTMSSATWRTAPAVEASS
jgi:hypothetical protein